MFKRATLALLFSFATVYADPIIDENKPAIAPLDDVHVTGLKGMPDDIQKLAIEIAAALTVYRALQSIMPLVQKN